MSTPWLPIDTAPKDGTPFLAAIWDDESCEWEVLRMRWYDYRNLFGDATYCPFLEDQTQPTLWMPIPIPPLPERK